MQTRHRCSIAGCFGKVLPRFQEENADPSDERVKHVLEASQQSEYRSSRQVW